MGFHCLKLKACNIATLTENTPLYETLPYLVVCVSMRLAKKNTDSFHPQDGITAHRPTGCIKPRDNLTNLCTMIFRRPAT